MKNLAAIFLLFALMPLLVHCSDSGKKGQAEGVLNDSVPASLKTLNERIAAAPNDAEAFHARSKYYLQSGKVNEALGDINKALQLKPDDTGLLFTLSDIYFAMGKAPNSRETLLMIAEREPENTEALLKLAELSLYFRDYEQTMAFLKRTAEINPSLAKPNFIRGFVQKEQGDTAAAIKSFRQATVLDPDYYDAYVQLGILHAAQGDILAIDYYKNALRIRPKSVEAMYNLALFYQGTEGYNEAIGLYNDIIGINPAFKFAYYNLGYIHLVYLGVYDVAVGYFNKAIEKDPGYFEAYYNRGYSYELLGDVMNARKDYSQSLRIKPDYQLSIRGLNRLDEQDRLMEKNR